MIYPYLSRSRCCLAVTLGKQYKVFEPLLEEGRRRFHLKLAGDEAVKFLTTKDLMN